MIRSIAGITLIALGVVGIVLPLMPGLPLLIAGAALLGADHPLRRAFVGYIARLRRRAQK